MTQSLTFFGTTLGSIAAIALIVYVISQFMSVFMGGPQYNDQQRLNEIHRLIETGASTATIIAFSDDDVFLLTSSGCADPDAPCIRICFIEDPQGDRFENCIESLADVSIGTGGICGGGTCEITQEGSYRFAIEGQEDKRVNVYALT